MGKRVFLTEIPACFDQYFGREEEQIRKYAEKLFENTVKSFADKGKTVSVAESCTGGLIGAFFTSVSGASSVFCGGMMTYTNQVKINNLGVSEQTISRHTEVSFETAAEMAERARELFKTDLAVSVTGYAGPTGGNESDPVGTVYVGISSEDDCNVYRLSLGDKDMDREQVRLNAVCFAGLALRDKLDKI